MLNFCGKVFGVRLITFQVLFIYKYLKCVKKTNLIMHTDIKTHINFIYPKKNISKFIFIWGLIYMEN